MEQETVRDLHYGCGECKTEQCCELWHVPQNYSFPHLQWRMYCMCHRRCQHVLHLLTWSLSCWHKSHYNGDWLLSGWCWQTTVTCVFYFGCLAIFKTRNHHHHCRIACRTLGLVTCSSPINNLEVLAFFLHGWYFIINCSSLSLSVHQTSTLAFL